MMIRFAPMFASLALLSCGASNDDFTSIPSSVEFEKLSSGIGHIPSSAHNIKYESDAFLDKYEYLYFVSDSSEALDFYDKFVGNKLKEGYRFSGNQSDPSWWTKSASKVGVGGSSNEGGAGVKEVFISPDKGRSEVWVFYGHN